MKGPTAKTHPRIEVPLVDLKAQFASIRSDVLAAIERVFASGHFILASEGEQLEGEIARYCQTRFAVGCASGTDALQLSLMALGIEAGDEAITVPLTFLASASCAARLGARPVFVDIDPRTFTLDPNRLEPHLRRLGANRLEHTRAVIPVHLYGQCADMDSILCLADEFELAVIEDAAQAIGAESHSRKAGSMGWAGCLSFYPTKNLGAYGDGGMVTTNDEAAAVRIRSLRAHGAAEDKHHFSSVGINSRLDELQAAMLRVKMDRLEPWIEARRVHAQRYDQLFKAAGLADGEAVYPDRWHPVVVPFRAAKTRHVFHQYCIRARDRDGLQRHLAEWGVGTDVYYPVPLHLQACFAGLGYKPGDFPEAERAARELLALPVYAELSAEQQAYVVDRIVAFYV